MSILPALYFLCWSMYMMVSRHPESEPLQIQKHQEFREQKQKIDIDGLEKLADIECLEDSKNVKSFVRQN